MAHTAPQTDMGNFIAESKRLIHSSLLQNIYKAYRAALNKFQLFLNIYGLQQTPAQQHIPIFYSLPTHPKNVTQFSVALH